MSEISTKTSRFTENPASSLQNYRQRKLYLAGVIRSAMELFHKVNDSREHQARLLLSRLAEDRFNLAVVGQFKRGKSSLMNAVIGMNRLPTGILPLTSVVTTVRYGEHESVLIRTTGLPLSREIPIEELEEYVTDRGNPGNRKHVECAEVLLPSEILRLGFHFIDTPGIGSSIAENTGAAHRFLPEADAIIFVTSFESPLNEVDLDFLRMVVHHVNKIFFVVNKLDLVSAQESEEVLKFVRDTISSHLGSTNPRVFALSACQGLEAKLSGNLEMLAKSRLPELEAALVRFLTSEREHVSLVRCIDRAEALLAPERIKSLISNVQAGIGGKALRSMKHNWELKVHQIEQECIRTVKTLRRYIRTELPACFDPAISEHCTEVRDDIAEQVGQFLESKKTSITAQDLRQIVKQAGTVATDRRRQWLAGHQQEFEQTLRSFAKEHADGLERSYDKALNLASEIFGTKFPVSRWIIHGDKTDFYLRGAIPFEWNPRFAWELDIFPVRWVRRRIRRTYDQTLEMAITAYREHLVKALSEAGSEWANSLGFQILESIKSLNIRTTRVLSGHADSGLSGQFDAVLHKLETLRREVIITNHEKISIYSPMRVQRHAIHRCLICERIEAELFNFLTKHQSELSMNEAKLDKHAAIGGFCPLHTWQYARITSPQSISLTYGPLLAAVAHELRKTASSISSAMYMTDLNKLIASTETCPACRRIGEAEERAIEEFQKSFSCHNGGEQNTGLCLHHLRAVLSREADLERARHLISELADSFRHISEDMQTYSLKHDALRRELTNEDESMAYLYGLSLLVGRKGLSVA